MEPRVLLSGQQVISALASPGTIAPPFASPAVSGPVAHDDVIDTDEGNAVSIDVLANDSAPNGFDISSLKVVSNPSHGTAAPIAATSMILYTPAPGFFGTDTFKYTVKDPFGATSNEATVSVVVNRPTATDDFAETLLTKPVTIDVAANDTDPDGDNHLDLTTVKVVASPSHGSVSIDPTTGMATYTPAAGWAGTDTFGYTITDKAGATSNVATVTVVTDLGQISGILFLDSNTDHIQEPGESGLPGRLVYLDLNNDGQDDSGEPTTVTNSDGQYTFGDLPAGSYTVREFPDTNDDVVQTSLPAGAYSETITPDNFNVTGPALGNVLISPQSPVHVFADPFPTGLNNANATFVQGAANNILGHTLDSAAAETLARQLSRANGSRLRVAKVLWESSEHRTAQVLSYYQTFLGQAPSASQMSTALHQFKRGGHETDVLSSLLAGPGFSSQFSSNSTYVQALYSKVLGRAPSSGELSSLQTRLDRHTITRKAAAETILTSPEASSAVLNGYSAAFLQTPATFPGAPALLNPLRRGGAGVESVAVSLLSSGGYFARAVVNSQ